MSKQKKSVCLCGFWFHIVFDNGIGTDQNGDIWINPEKPQLRDEEILNKYLDTYNEIQKELKSI